MWRDEGLQVPAKTKKKKRLSGVGANVGAKSLLAPNALWAVDFQFDHTRRSDRIGRAAARRGDRVGRKEIVEHRPSPFATTKLIDRSRSSAIAVSVAGDSADTAGVG